MQAQPVQYPLGEARCDPCSADVLVHHRVTPAPKDSGRRAEWRLPLKPCFSQSLTKRELLFQEASKVQQIWIKERCTWRTLEDRKPPLNPVIPHLQESEAELSVTHKPGHT